MKRNRSYSSLLILALLFFPIHLIAQDLVSVVNDEGLEKTISYDVAKFTDIRDRKMEDVLKKFPGMSCENFDGWTMLSYNGMEVEKIYVGGIDMLEGNFLPVLSMKPQDVASVEIMENHSEQKVVQGIEYSAAVALNIILKPEASSKWSGSMKAGVGASPFLYSADLSALNIGKKIQTTVVFKADDTGMNLGGNTGDFGDWESGGDWGMGQGGRLGGSYAIREFLNVEPSLAPLASERVRMNKSMIGSIGTTFKMNEDLQANVLLSYHRDRLDASSLDETTYFLDGGSVVTDVTGEEARSTQNDFQASVNLLSNTSKRYFSNVLSLNTRWRDVDKDITGTFPNDQKVHVTPLQVKDNLTLKKRVGRNILGVDVLLTHVAKPQELHVTKPFILPENPYEVSSKAEDLVPTGQEGPVNYFQNITSRSTFVDASASYSIKMGDYNLMFQAGGSLGQRKLTTSLTPGSGLETAGTDSRISSRKGYAQATLSYVTDQMQAQIALPLSLGSYSLKDRSLNEQFKDHKWYFCPSLSLKWQVSNRFSLTGNASTSTQDVSLSDVYSGIILNDFRSAQKGVTDLRTSTGTNLSLSAAYRDAERSIFASGSINQNWSKPAYIDVMDFVGDYIISGFQKRPKGVSNSTTWMNADLSKGISSLMGKVGIQTEVVLSSSTMVRNEVKIPFSSTSITLKPYVNGKVLPWMNVVYDINFNWMRMKMSQDETASHTKSYTQNLELIFSFWEKMNFSLKGEHYYTEFTDDVSKHLVMADFKAEYKINDKWELLLSLTNLFNQKTYNFTMVDSQTFTKSYTSYQIRPRNLLMSLYYKF